MKFFHRVDGARFFMPDGKDICFAGGSFDTEMVKDESLRRQVELELKKVANVPASQIYTKDPVIPVEEAEVTREILGSATQSFDSANRVPQGATTTKIDTPRDPKPTLQGSSGAASLADAMAKAKEAVATTKAKATEQHAP